MLGLPDSVAGCLFDLDAVLAAREHLAGKPAPDTFLAGARALAELL